MSELRGHVVVCGLEELGLRIVEELDRLGEQVVVLAHEPDARYLAVATRLGASIVARRPGGPRGPPGVRHPRRTLRGVHGRWRHREHPRRARRGRPRSEPACGAARLRRGVRAERRGAHPGCGRAVGVVARGARASCRRSWTMRPTGAWTCSGATWRSGTPTPTTRTCWPCSPTRAQRPVELFPTIEPRRPSGDGSGVGRRRRCRARPEAAVHRRCLRRSGTHGGELPGEPWSPDPDTSAVRDPTHRPPLLGAAHRHRGAHRGRLRRCSSCWSASDPVEAVYQAHQGRPRQRRPDGPDDHRAALLRPRPRGRGGHLPGRVLRPRRGRVHVRARLEHPGSPRG